MFISKQLNNLYKALLMLAISKHLDNYCKLHLSHIYIKGTFIQTILSNLLNFTIVSMLQLSLYFHYEILHLYEISDTLATCFRNLSNGNPTLYLFIKVEI